MSKCHIVGNLMHWLKFIQLHTLIWRCADVSLQIQYCSESCREAAWQLYHQCLCLGSAREDPEHPVNRLLELWRSVKMSLHVVEHNHLFE